MNYITVAFLMLFSTISLNMNCMIKNTREQAARDLLHCLDINDIHTKLIETQEHMEILYYHQQIILFHLESRCKGCTKCSHDNSYSRFFALENKIRALKKNTDDYEKLIDILIVYYSLNHLSQEYTRS